MWSSTSHDPATYGVLYYYVKVGGQLHAVGV